MKSFNGFEVLQVLLCQYGAFLARIFPHSNKIRTRKNSVFGHFSRSANKTNNSKEVNTTQSKIQSNNINIKETRRPQVAVNEFPERQHIFKRHKIFLGEWLYSEATNSRMYNSSNIIVFSDSIASFTQNIRSNFNNHLKEGRARFKCFPVLF